MKTTRMEVNLFLLAAFCLVAVPSAQGQDLVNGIGGVVNRVLNSGGQLPADAADAIAIALDNQISPLIGQRRSNENGTDSKNRQFLWQDQSNEGLGRATPQQLISKAGFNFENYYVLADDGYITQLIRLVNPLADRTQLKQPPVMLIHGGILDQSVYVWASISQSFPEKYPRDLDDPPISSSNRSLAIVLVNNGYDVWLVGTRGSNYQNQGFVNPEKFGRNVSSQARAMWPNKNFNNLTPLQPDYWRYSMDDIVEFELPRQIDRVLALTGASKVSLIPISFGTMITLSMLISNKDYANKVHVHVEMLPIINNIGTNNLLRGFQESSLVTDDNLGIVTFTDGVTSQQTRDTLDSLNSVRLLRYTIIWLLTIVVTGPSPLYQTNLESAVVGHLFQPTSFVEVKHWSQQITAGQLQKFSYNPAQNLGLYSSIKPPVRDLANLGTPTWMVVYGGNDKLAPLASANQVIRQANPQPEVRVFVPSYNHLDAVAAQDNDVQINLPILSFMDRHSLAPLSQQPSAASLVEVLKASGELEAFVPKGYLVPVTRRRSSSSSISTLRGSLLRPSRSQLIAGL